MALTLRDQENTQATAGGQLSHVLTKPVGVADGDALMYFVAFSSSPGTVTPPGAPFSVLGEFSNGTQRCILLYKAAGASEANPTITTSTSCESMCVALAVDATTSLGLTAFADLDHLEDSTADTAIDVPAVTALSTSDMDIIFLASTNSDGFGVDSWTGPGGYTALVQMGDTGDSKWCGGFYKIGGHPDVDLEALIVTGSKTTQHTAFRVVISEAAGGGSATKMMAACLLPAAICG